MSSLCLVPQNYPIYQTLLDKGASYPADKPYQAKAYKKAAEYVASMNMSIYDSHRLYARWGDAWVAPDDSGIGCRIENFINEFIKANPTPSIPKNPMDAARVLAAQNAPKDATAWPNDDAERAAFKQKVAAYYTDETPKVTEWPSVHPALAPLRTTLSIEPKPAAPARQLPRTIACGGVGWGYCGCEGCPDNRIKPNWSIYDYTPVTYTAENPRRSKRLAGKPKPNYFPKEDEQDEIEDLIESICKKKGWEFSEDLITEFNAWMVTEDKYGCHKYDYKTNKYVPKPMNELVKDWLMYYSEDIQQQRKEQNRAKAILNYCKKNNIKYTPLMDEKFAQWAADPVNKKLITYSEGRATYDHTAGYCVNKWFSTLKKTVVL